MIWSFFTITEKISTDPKKTKDLGPVFRAIAIQYLK